jgi:hypothetical protein
MRRGVESLEPEQEAKRVDIQIVVARGMADAAHGYLGKTDYVVVHRAKLMLIAFPRARRKTVLVSNEPDFPLGRLKALMKVVDSDFPK